MRIVTAVLVISLAVVLFLPGWVWAPPIFHFFQGEAASISADVGPTLEDPWSRVRVKANLWGTTNDGGDPNSDLRGEGGDVRF